MLPYYTK